MAAFSSLEAFAGCMKTMAPTRKANMVKPRGGKTVKLNCSPKPCLTYTCYLFFLCVCVCVGNLVCVCNYAVLSVCFFGGVGFTPTPLSQKTDSEIVSFFSTSSANSVVENPSVFTNPLVF